MIDIEEHLQRAFGSEEVGMPTEKWVEVLEELRQLREENQTLRDRLTQPNTTQVTGEVPCKTHPDAPHGFDRNASHSEDRYVCECESWEPPPKREWVGLEDEDVATVKNDFNRGALWAEAKLKEKNT